MGFDEVVFACHGDQVLPLLEDATDRERDVFGSFSHDDQHRLAAHRRVGVPSARRRGRRGTIGCRTSRYGADGHLSPQSAAEIRVAVSSSASRSTRRQFPNNGHPQVRLRAPALRPTRRFGAQERWREVSGVKRTHYCGAYWFHGFHEDGLRSALRVSNSRTPPPGPHPPPECASRRSWPDRGGLAGPTGTATLLGAACRRGCRAEPAVPVDVVGVLPSHLFGSAHLHGQGHEHVADVASDGPCRFVTVGAGGQFDDAGDPFANLGHVIVNRSAANLLWPGQSPTGRRIRREEIDVGDRRRRGGRRDAGRLPRPGAAAVYYPARRTAGRRVGDLFAGVRREDNARRDDRARDSRARARGCAEGADVSGYTMAGSPKDSMVSCRSRC